MGIRAVSAGLWLLVTASVVGCSPDLSEPTISSVSPAEWYNGLDVELTITGEDLFPTVQVGGGAVDIDRDYRIWLESSLGDVELEGVTLRSYTELGGWVRAGIPAGRYDLRVQSPTGAEVVLPDAFRATETAVKSIELDLVGSYSPRVGETVAFDVRLEGWNDEQIYQPLEIDIVAERDDGEIPAVSFSAVLDNQRTLEDELGITGSLDENGEATVLFTNTTPGKLELEVRPVQEDSPIDAARLNLYFEAGAVDDIAVELSDESRSFVAGDIIEVDLTLLDELDNVTSVDNELTVHVFELCANDNSNDQYVGMIDTRTVSFEIHGACAENQIIARVAEEKATLESTSDFFSVSPNEPETFVATSLRQEVTAGKEPVPVTILVQDGFGNLISDYNESLQFEDAESDPVDSTCYGFENGGAFCEVTLVRAGQTSLRVTNPDLSLRGDTDTLTVIPGDPSIVELLTTDGASSADDGRTFSLQVLDEYRNVIGVPATGSDAPSFSLGGTAVDCLREGSDDYHCTLTEAGEERELTVNVLGLATLSNTFDVVNGALSTITFSGPGDLKAGQSVSITLTGRDAHGNPFLEVGSGSADLELFDDSGDVSEPVTLNTDGTATLSSLSLTTSWQDNQLHAWQGGTWLGTSSPFTVAAADMDHFLVEPEQGWAWVDEALSVSVSAVDPYDNVIDAYSGTISLSSTNSQGDSVSSSAFSRGIALVDFTPDTAGFSDSLSASDGTFSGTSSRLDILDGDCSDGPVAALTIDGSDIGLACRTSGTTPPLTLSSSGSLSGGGTLTSWYFYAEPTGWQRSNSSSITETWTAEGAWPIAVVVADDSACADAASSVVYVADDDGEPAGPVSVSLSSSALMANSSSSSGKATATFEAIACTGSAASGGTLALRADRGELTGSGLASTGSGLSMTLDSAGQGSATWTVGSQTYAGDATLYVGTLNQASIGAAAASVGNDAHSPTVIGVSPAGTQSEAISSLQVRFSEPLDADTINDSTVLLIDPDGLSVDILDHTLSDSELGVGDLLTDSVLDITLTSEVDLSEGAWTLWLSSSITDAAGNGLDGGFTGSTGIFTLTIGDVDDDAPGMSQCQLSTDTFRPDGDDGSGKEADEVSLSLTADDVSSWWQLEVFSSAGELILLEHVATSSDTDTISWDGRGGDGRVVENGSYVLRVVARDDAWNSGSACSNTVTIDNLLE